MDSVGRTTKFLKESLLNMLSELDDVDVMRSFLEICSKFRLNPLDGAPFYLNFRSGEIVRLLINIDSTISSRWLHSSLTEDWSSRKAEEFLEGKINILRPLVDLGAF